ncbi:MAG: 23S rRNA (uracil(1939)-C(5))-methyltransferase RlmD [Clostridia bacterium]|nr:23S rRNA (uracil(1939)-C(5))-methyltransferase RlmD [Clostridia bacterium]
MEKTIKLKIIGYGMNGEGVAKYKDLTVFIPFCMQDETVLAKITKQKDKIAFAELVEIIEPHPNRITPLCPHYKQCGGCNLMHMPYATQLKTKQSALNSTLAKQLGHGHEVKPTTPSPCQTAYRNKIELTVQDDKIGFLSPASHKLVEITTCKLAGDWLERFLQIARPALKHNTDIKNIVIRTAQTSTSITFVTKTANRLSLKNWLMPLEKEFKNLAIFQNINTKKTSEIFGEKFIHLYGAKTQDFEFCGIKYSASPYSFLQINDQIAQKIYEKTLENIHANANVINAYSGAGFLTAMLAKRAKKVVGIEINRDATQDANRLMQENNIKNVQNICGDCAKLTSVLFAFTGSENTSSKGFLEENNKKPQKNNVFSQKINEKTEIIDIPQNKNKIADGEKTPSHAVFEDVKKNNLEDFILVVDPPRAGLDKKFTAAVLNAKPEKIIYISCNPATLARDLKALSECYKISLIEPFDMFPQTKHVETLVVLTRK